MPPHPPFIEAPDPDATLLAQIRAQYEAGEITATQAARALGFSRSTLTKRMSLTISTMIMRCSARWASRAPP